MLWAVWNWVWGLSWDVPGLRDPMAQRRWWTGFAGTPQPLLGILFFQGTLLNWGGCASLSTSPLNWWEWPCPQELSVSSGLVGFLVCVCARWVEEGREESCGSTPFFFINDLSWGLPSPLLCAVDAGSILGPHGQGFPKGMNTTVCGGLWGSSSNVLMA